MPINDLITITPSTEMDVVWVDAAPADGASEVPPLSARQVVEKFRISLHTLRHLEARGLVVPMRAGRACSYGPREQLRLDQILTGCRLGFTFAEIERVIAAEGGRWSAPALDAIRRKSPERSCWIKGQVGDMLDELAALRRIHLALSSAPFGFAR